jgi:hypothetical protein
MTSENVTYADLQRKPHSPSGEKKCKSKPTTPPILDDPKKCKDPDCDCPPAPGSTSNCIEDLIEKQKKEIAAAKKAEDFKKDLEALLAKAKAASQEYTQEKYDNLGKLWADQDLQIVELIRKLECTVECWRCVIECTICPKINELHTDQLKLYGDNTLYKEVHNLYDLQYWQMRDKDKKERTFNRIKSVLAAWENPAKFLEKNLTDDAKLISDSLKNLNSEPGKVIYDIFFRLVPMHMAIAPTIDSKWKTKILKEWTEFCTCDDETPCGDETPCDDVTYDEDGNPTKDDYCCCGPNVGERSIRQQLIGPQPYLVDPNDYFSLVCCLVEQWYEPAKNDLANAVADLAATDDKIKALKANIENGIKSFEKDAKTAIPSTIDCAKYKKKESDSDCK